MMMRICTCNAEVLVLFVEEPSTRTSKSVFGHVCFVCNAPQSRPTVSRGVFDNVQLTVECRIEAVSSVFSAVHQKGRTALRDPNMYH